MAPKRTYYKNKGKKTNLAKNTKKAVRKVVKDVLKKKVELKYNDQTTYAAAAGTALTDAPGVFGNLIQVARGTADTERIGDQITLKSLKIWLRIWQPDPGAGATDENFARFVVFQWHSPTVPTAADIFQYPATVAYLSPFKVDSNRMYTILYEKTFRTVSTGSTATQVLNLNLRYIRKTLKFDGAVNTQPYGDQIYFTIFCNTPIANVTPPKYALMARIFYTDQ